MGDLMAAIDEVIAAIPEPLRRRHGDLIAFMRSVAAEGRKLVIHADTDADGASAHVLGEIAKRLGVKNVTVKQVDRSQVFLNPSDAHIVYDISVSPDAVSEKMRHRVANVDHHQPKSWPDIAVIANPFYVVPNAPREYYAFNPSVQLLSIAKKAGVPDEDLKLVALFSAIGAVGDRAHHYMPEIRRLAEAVAEEYGLKLEDLTKIADLFEYPERFPGKIELDEIREVFLNALWKGKPMAVFEDKKIGELRRRWEEALAENIERVLRGEYETFEVPVSGKRLKIIAYHVPEAEAREIQKIKSAIGSKLLEIFDKHDEPVLVMAGQWEPGDVMNYRLGLNEEAIRMGLHAGEIARALSSMFGEKGGGHEKVAGAKIPHGEHRNIREHMKRALERAIRYK